MANADARRQARRKSDLPQAKEAEFQQAVADVVLDADIAAVAPITAETIELPPVKLPAAQHKEATMTDTTTANTTTDAAKSFAEDLQARASTAFGDMNSRAKDAFTKGQKSMEELAEFNRGNVDALVQSARTAATGWQNIAAYTVDYAKTYVATAQENTRKLTAVKSPTEFFQTGQEIAKANLDEAVAQMSKFTEGYLKLLGDIAQPISNRYALAADKLKSATTAA